MNPVKRRFIAGAVCPKCSEMDTIYMYTEDDKTLRACVSCDFTDELRLHSTPAELTTRVNKHKTETQVVTLIDPDKT